MKNRIRKVCNTSRPWKNAVIDDDYVIQNTRKDKNPSRPV
jgi:hypothetical protein